eukprot:scaffold9953_cov32-Tisochrysis_lutea.AAC.5
MALRPSLLVALLCSAAAWQWADGGRLSGGVARAQPIRMLATTRKPGKAGGARSRARSGRGGSKAKKVVLLPEVPPSPPGTALTEPVYERLTDWLISEGANLANVAIADFGGLRGVMATRSIAPGEEVIAIPASCALDLGVQGADPVPAALRMLAQREMEEGTEREAYYATLPPPDSSDLCTPDFFSEKELQMLQWPPLIVDVRKRSAAVRKVLGGTAPSGDTPISQLAIAGGRMREVRWAVWLIQSRVLTVLGPDGEGHKLLIPFIDMFNHRASSKHYLTGRTDGMLRVVAGAPISVGDQIEIVYGTSDTSNAEFLGHYGFVDPAAAAADEAMLKAHPEAKPMLLQTSIEEDEALLAAEPPQNEALALQFRLAMKRALSRSGASVGFGR